MADDGQIVAIVKALEQFSERVVKKITLDVTANLIQTTPLLTGWARANWIPSLTRPLIQDISSKSGADRDTFVPDAESQQNDGKTQILSYRLAQGSVFITNNVPYINDLNDGSSKKAPAMFVQAAIEKAVTQDIRTL